MKRGPAGDFSKGVWKAKCGAFTTCIKLEQAHSKKQSTLNQMACKVNLMVAKAGHKKTGNDLARKLKSCTADLFAIDRVNVQELRRLQWTLHSNLAVWFDTWKQTLIHLEFARETLPGDKCEGELFFFEGQLRRIVNLEETDGSMDNTNGLRGGRKPMTFYAHDISGGGNMANKTSYSSTIICGSNVAGEALPPHFQLKTLATSDEREKINIEFIGLCKDVRGQFGFPGIRRFPCSFGLNDKGGMNAEELKKYFDKNTLPLYPDIKDAPDKRVTLKVDSGPGRMNINMLASLRIKGLHLVPGVPNTTAKTQETDQNYGPFKTHYRGNLQQLATARHEKKQQLMLKDLALLVFGGTDPVTGIELEDSFGKAFSKRICLSAWKQCGAVPLTRAPLEDPGLRHDLIVNADGTTVKDLDPEGLKLLQIEQENKVHCTFLKLLGYDAEHLRGIAPRRKAKNFQLTVRHSKERIALLQRTKTAGLLFHATHGEHLNSDDFFLAKTTTDREARIAQLEKEKKSRKKTSECVLKAKSILAAKGEPTLATIDTFTREDLHSLHRYKMGTLGSGSKEKLLEVYLAAPPPLKDGGWGHEDEAELERLKNTSIKFEDTALAVALDQNAKSVTLHADKLSESDAAALIVALHKRNDNNNNDGDNQFGTI